MDQSLPRVVYNALPLDPRGGGVSTYIRELLKAMSEVIDARLAAAVRPVGLAELPPGIEPLIKGSPAGFGVRSLERWDSAGPI